MFRGIADSNVCPLDRRMYICIECFVYSKEVNTLLQETLQSKGQTLHNFGPTSSIVKPP